MTEPENRRSIDELRNEISKSQVLTTAAIESARRDIMMLQGQIAHLEQALIERVQRLEFVPVKLITYALAGGTLTTVLGAILAKVILK